MKQSTKSAYSILNYLDYLGDWNPQFLREIKGKLKAKNIVITVLFSVAAQFILVINQLGELPDVSYQVIKEKSAITYKAFEQYSRYCLAKPHNYKYNYNHDNHLLCNQDLLNHWMINWQLFWFDIFVTISIVSIALLLVLGTYFLISNAIKESQQETLNLVRLTPQSASNIFLGKILGVPILLYLFTALAIPLHTIAGLKAQIPLNAIVGFDLAVIASCAFFYSLALLLSYLIPKSLSSWAITIAIAFFLGITTILNTHKYDTNTNTIIDWFLLFNPNNLILYLGDLTGIPYHHFNYFDFLPDRSYKSDLSSQILFNNLSFYGQAFWQKFNLGISLVIANYCLWTYWLWQGLKRHFYNPENTIITKQQSYWITGYFCLIGMGFSFYNQESYLETNIVLFEFFLLFLLIGLIFALTPQRYILQDWARYRHQMQNKGNILWRELVLGEKSPSTIAMVINILIATLYLLPFLFIFPLEIERNYVFLSLIMIVGTFILYAAIAQLILLSKSKHRLILAFTTITSLVIALPISFSLFSFFPENHGLIWLFTFIPFVGIQNTTLSTVTWVILGQWLAITIVSLQITNKLRQAGKSETSKLLSNY